MARGGVLNGRAQSATYETFGPKPGLMTMTNRDVFAVIWQGGGGYGDPLDRDPMAVARDVACNAVSRQAAREIYGVALDDAAATERLRREMRLARIPAPVTDAARFSHAPALAALGPSLKVVRDGGDLCVVSPAGCILARGHSRWREGAIGVSADQLPNAHAIRLHEGLAVTVWYCPANGTQLAVDIHRRGTESLDDTHLDLEALVHRSQTRN